MATADYESKSCPYCAETIRAEAVVCHYCGRDLRTPSQRVRSAWKSIPTWLVVILVIAGIYTISELQDARVERNRAVQATAEEEAFRERCPSWEEASHHEGQKACFTGIIARVKYDYDETSRSNVWTAYFNPNPDYGLRLIRLEQSMADLEGECVIVTGHVMKHDNLGDNVETRPPSMIDTSPYYSDEGRGFEAYKAREHVCD